MTIPLLLTMLGCVDGGPGSDGPGDGGAIDTGPAADGGFPDGGFPDGGSSDGGGDDGGTDGGGGDGGSEAEPPPPGPPCTGQPWPYTQPFNVLAWHAAHGTADDAVLDDLAALAADLEGGAGGPWNDVVVGPWTSADGVGWSLDPSPAALEAASVPAATIGPDGDLWVFFVDGDLDAMLDAASAGIAMEGLGVRGLGGLGAARSSDGVHFERVELLLEGEGPLLVVDPDIVTLPDGSYRLYAYGIPAEEMCGDTADPFQVPPPHRAWAARSDDLVHWQAEGVVFTVDYSGTDPAVWCQEDLATCWILMGLAGESLDGGLSFTSASLALPSPTPQVPTVFRRSSDWRMLYRDPGVDRTMATTSTDGRTWTEGEVADPDVDSPTVTGTPGDWWLYGAEHR